MWRGNIQENILYEDSQILVCHKPAGLAVQNAKMGSMDMESALKKLPGSKVRREECSVAWSPAQTGSAGRRSD